MTNESRADAVRRTLDAVWRMESPRLVAALTRRTGDVALAEDLAQEALVAAMEQWPADGVPQNPGGWLMAVARRRSVDHVRHAVMARDKHERLGRELAIEEERAPDADEAAIDESTIDDDVLRLVFMCCHPVLSEEARVALTLRLLGGLRTDEIARAFLVPEPTIQQRIVRAKRTLASARVRFEVPTGADFAQRLDAVLRVIYLIFNEGYAATAGEDWIRPALAEEALRLGRVLAALVPEASEAQGLVALMELQASRMRARTDRDGSPVPLDRQDRARWDRLLIGRGLAALARAEALAPSLGPYALQAAIAACHATAPTADATDWPRIVALYDALAQLTPSPVIELNRAVAVGFAFGPEAALELVDALADDPRLRDYHLVAAVRAEFLERAGRTDEAAAEFARAASMTRNLAERRLLLERAAVASDPLAEVRHAAAPRADESPSSSGSNASSRKGDGAPGS